MLLINKSNKEWQHKKMKRKAYTKQQSATCKTQKELDRTLLSVAEMEQRKRSSYTDDHTLEEPAVGEKMETEKRSNELAAFI